MDVDQDQIFTIIHEFCHSLILSLENSINNQLKFANTIEKLIPIIQRTNMFEYFEEMKKGVLKSAEEDRETIKESIAFLESMKHQWELAAKSKTDITYN